MYQGVLVQSKKISRDEFVRKLRFIVGDNIIKAAITNTHFKVPNLFILKIYLGIALLYFFLCSVYTSHQNHLKLKLQLHMLFLTFALQNHINYLLQFYYAS